MAKEKQSFFNSPAVQEIKTIFHEHHFGRLFSGNTTNGLIQFFRYCFVGASATIVDWGVSAILFYAVFGQAHAGWANGISFVIGLIVNYLLSTFWAFRGAKIESRVLEFLGFAAIGVVGLILTVFITKIFEWTLSGSISAYQMLGKIVSTAIAFLWNFFARKYFLYNKKDDENENKIKS